MKKTSPTFLLLFLFATAATAQEIPGIKKQPKWAMPFYFEDANGERDTVWVGYDPSAQIGPAYFDPQFEIWEYIDTSKFGAFLYLSSTGNPKDSAKKIEICLDLQHSHARINFISGKMPITMKWDNSRFYSDSLPYPDISPRPRGRANLDCSNYEMGYHYCYTPSPHPSLVLTDYYSSDFQMTRVYSDSFFFDGSGNVSAEKSIGIYITIVPHIESPVGIKETGQLLADVYPNPFTDVVHIEGIVGQFEITLQEITGRSINHYSIILQLGERYSLDLSDVQQGIYLLSIKSATAQVTKKLIK